MSSGSAVRHPAWDDVRRDVAARLDAGAGVIAVVGTSGTGKSLLLAGLARSLRGRGRTVRTRRGETAAGPGEVLLLDDADAAEDMALLALSDTGGVVILAGSPGLAFRLEGLGVPATVVPLRGLLPDEVPDFVAARLTASGHPPDLFAPEAVETLGRLSAGVPRALNALLGAALVAASLEDAPHVTAEHVKQVAALRGEVGAAAARHGEAAEGAPRRALPEPRATSPLPEPKAPAGAASPPLDGGDGPAELVVALSAAAAVARARADEMPALLPATTEAVSRPGEAGDAASREDPAAGRMTRDEHPVVVAAPDGTALVAAAAAPVEATAAETVADEPVPEGTVPPVGRPPEARPALLRALPRPRASVTLGRPTPLRAAAVVAVLLLGTGTAWFGMGVGERAGAESAVTAWIEPAERAASTPPAAAGPEPAREGDGSPAGVGPATMTPRAGTVPDVARAASASPAARPAPLPGVISASPPVAGPLRIVLHRPPGGEGGAERAMAALSAAFGPFETRVVASTPRAPAVRYFHEADAAAAARVARALGEGGTVRVQDMTSFRPLPRPGTVEAWVP